MRVNWAVLATEDFRQAAGDTAERSLFIGSRRLGIGVPLARPRESCSSSGHMCGVLVGDWKLSDSGTEYCNAIKISVPTKKGFTKSGSLDFLAGRVT